MSNPYAPPATREKVPENTSDKKEVFLRRLGALSSGYVMVRAMLGPLPDLPTMGFAVAVMGAFIHGFLRGGRKSHLGIALFIALIIATQTYFVSRAIAHPERIPVPMGPHPWLDFALGIVPHTIALVCGATLYFKARRATLETA